MPRKPPADVSEALRDGGIPKGWTPAQLQWLEHHHNQLARNSTMVAHVYWRGRWAYTCHDLLATIVATPKG